LPGEAAGNVDVDMGTGIERWQRLIVRCAQLETANILGLDDFAGDVDLKHDFSLHIEVAAEKRTAKKGACG
jgi:hypothetical protein